MGCNPEFELRKQSIKKIILKAILFWVVGCLTFGLIELWANIIKYHWGFQHLAKIIVEPFVYVFIGMIGGGILGGIVCLFSKAFKRDWLENAHLESFFVSTNISFIVFIWAIVWTKNIYNISELNQVVGYIFKIGLLFISCILGYIVFRFLKRKKVSERLVTSYIALSLSLYTFLMIEIYLRRLYMRSIIQSIIIFLVYNLLSLIGCIILGLVVYYLSMLIMKFDWPYRTGIVAAITVVITLILSFPNRNIDAKQEKPKKINIVLNKSELINRKKPNILFLTVDALRADSLSCYGYKEIKTPSIDSVAGKGVLFTNTIAQSSWTLPSFASMLTSLYPSVHGAQKKQSKKMNSCYQINKNTILMQEILKDIGYSTHAFIYNSVISSAYGFTRGFDDFFNIYRELVKQKRKRSAKFLWRDIISFDKNKIAVDENNVIALTQNVINWLESNTKQPFFLWVHYLDPHSPYERYKTYGVNPSYTGRLKDIEFVRGLLFDHLKTGRHNLTPSDKDYLKTIYDEEILFVDENIGLILKKLTELNLIDNTLIIFSSDHGEEFWEHDDYNHGHSLYRELVHIPLILQLPGALPQGTRINSQVRAIDIMPTILGMLGVKHKLNIQGKSLLPLIKGEEMGNRTAFSESLFFFEERKSIRTGKYNFIYFTDSQKKELYDLESDPWELENIVDERPEVAYDLQNKLLDFMKDCRNIANTLGTEKHSKPVKLDEESKQRLKALGYL
jgi:arylsulfatase A-like enzyme